MMIICHVVEENFGHTKFDVLVKLLAELDCFLLDDARIYDALNDAGTSKVGLY